ncbi:MAG: hypothetical protein H7Y43_14290 [Akkermansiaceae bacterium]|nr:hypothetical protein [Verrucomicrobiales bacterium]
MIAILLALWSGPLLADDLAKQFVTPPASAKPWVYWYFMDGNLDRAGMTADLEAMKQAGIGGAIFLEINIGVPRGPVDFMSPQWQDLVAHAAREADRLNVQFALGAGPGWCGTGGPWIKPESAMQHLVGSATNVVGPALFSAELPRPQPRQPFFGEGTLTPALKKEWQDFYRDTAVLAFRTPTGSNQIADVDEKALYYRAPFSSQPGVKPFLPAPINYRVLSAEDCIQPDDVVDLTKQLSPSGQLDWQVPPGQWTIMRFGRTLTGQTTRPAPDPGLGFESGKFERASLDAQFAGYIQKLLTKIGPRTNTDGGLTMLHFDSWEMSAQNWSANFPAEFLNRRDYDSLKFLPVLSGRVVGSAETSERFLWDLRQTAQELVVDNHVGYLKEFAHENGLTLSVEPYDMNPASDLTLGRVADVPQCEFWNLGFDSAYSVIEAASIAHTCGRSVVAAEAFTSNPGEDWKAHPATLKAQGDWAFCAGVNRFAFHRFQAQPGITRRPGMAMGPYGVHWDRTQTWWDMVGAYHEYLARCQFLLQRGATVADVCFLASEGAPHVFRPPPSATTGNPPDHGGYNFDGCAPETLLERAEVKDGKIVFPGGTSYRVLVLPEQRTMTPMLLSKIKALVRAGATVFGPPPEKSPSLQGYPKCDTTIQLLARELWGDCDGKTVFSHAFGKGRVVWQETEVAPLAEYGDFAAVTNVLGKMGIAPDFASDGPIRFTHRLDGDTDIYFVANREARAVESVCQFRVAGRQPELWNPETGEISPLITYDKTPTGISVPLRFEANGSVFVVFRPQQKRIDPVVSFRRDGQPVLVSTKPPVIKVQKATFGVPGDAGRTRDVQTELQTLANRGEFGLQVGKLVEGGDPAYGFVKTLVVEYTVDDQPFVASGRESDTLSLVAGISAPVRAAEVRSDAAGRLEIVASRSGRYELKKASGQTRHVEVAMVPEPLEITGAWGVGFPQKWGAPDQIIVDQLGSLTESTNAGVRYFSGTATYTKTFDWNPSAKASNQKSEHWLDLGDVQVMAQVKLNGHDLGTVWKPPFRVDISAALKPGRNTLAVRVANLWPNRMIGDVALPAAERFTWSSHEPFTKDSPLPKSGLLGPVTIRTAQIVPLP